jgi:dTMP kinase
VTPQGTAKPARSQTPLRPAIQTGGYRRLLRDGRFRRLWVAQFVSGIGDWLVIGLLIPMVNALSGGSSFAVAGILIAKIIPALVLSSVTGVMVDLFDRRRVMITADLARFLLVLLLLGTNRLWVIYAVVLLMETASLFFWPARNALIPYLVDEGDVTAANGAMYTTQQASMLVGLTASGAILAGFEAAVRWVVSARLPLVDYFVGLLQPALLGPRAGFFLDALTFVFSASIVAGIRVIARPAETGGGFNFSLLGKDVVDSFRFLADHRELRALLLTVFFAILGGGAIIPVGLDYIMTLVGGVPFADRVTFLKQLSGTPQTFMLVFMALGMVIGALLVSRLEERVRRQLLFAGSVAAFGVAMLGFALVERYWVAGLFATAAGACIAVITVSGNSYVVHTTADEIRGRVFTAMESVIRVSLLLSMVVTAPLNDVLGGFVRRFATRWGFVPGRVTLTGPRVTLLLSALIVIGAAIYGFRTLEWRSAEKPGPRGDGESEVEGA